MLCKYKKKKKKKNELYSFETQAICNLTIKQVCHITFYFQYKYKSHIALHLIMKAESQYYPLFLSHTHTNLAYLVLDFLTNCTFSRLLLLS